MYIFLSFFFSFEEGKSMDDGSILISMTDLEQWVDGRRIQSVWTQGGRV